MRYESKRDQQRYRVTYLLYNILVHISITIEVYADAYGNEFHMTILTFASSSSLSSSSSSSSSHCSFVHWKTRLTCIAHNAHICVVPHYDVRHTTQTFSLWLVIFVEFLIENTIVVVVVIVINACSRRMSIATTNRQFTPRCVH